jgi:uncharacterized membrane protein YkvI
MSAGRGEGGFFSRLFAGRYGRYVLPAVIFQSVLIGGGYATGREIVQFGARFGALGVWNILAIFTGFTLTAILTYEFARVTRSYNYRSFMRHLIGWLWPLFDVLWVVLAVLIVAIMSAAAGEIGQQVLGIPYFAGVGLVIVVVAILNFYGKHLIEGFKSVGTTFLYLMYIVLAASILLLRWDNVQEVFATGNTAALDGSSFLNSPTIAAALAAGLLYVGYNLIVLTAVLFSLDRQTTRKETVLSGVITGVLATIPFILTYLCILGFYPGEEVLGAPVPWLAMVTQTGGSGLLAAFFAVMVVYTLIETATGLIHALTDRVSDTLKELGRRPLTGAQSALISGAVLAGAALLSQVGIIDLVAVGYTAMAYLFLALFALPLVTVGLYRILVSRGEPQQRVEP